MGKPKLEWIRNIEFTEDQQSLVAEVLSFVNDIGLPDHLDQSVFDEVFDKVLYPDTIKDKSPYDKIPQRY